MTTLVGVSVANRAAMALLDTSVNLYACLAEDGLSASNTGHF